MTKTAKSILNSYIVTAVGTILIGHHKVSSKGYRLRGAPNSRHHKTGEWGEWRLENSRTLQQHIAKIIPFTKKKKISLNHKFIRASYKQIKIKLLGYEYLALTGLFASVVAFALRRASALGTSTWVTFAVWCWSRHVEGLNCI